MFREPIEVVTVCLGYSDFLSETVPWNRQHFDRWVVVTSPEDEKTREVCRKYRLQCLTTDDHRRDGEFSKGRLVERGLQHLSANAWVMHLDADIVLPSAFRHDLDRAHLRPDAVHGFDRFMVDGWADWERLKQSEWLQRPNTWHPHGVSYPKGFKLGERWAGQDGWVPIGFAQMWHRKGGEEEWRGYRVKSYPIDHGTACRTDVQFALQWDRRDRVLVPEIYVAHLGSEDAPTGVNWKGRKSQPFGPADKLVNLSLAPS